MLEKLSNMFKAGSSRQDSISTLIGSETVIKGNIQFLGGLRIDGMVQGDVSELADTPSTLVLSEHGTIQGKINVSKVVLNGKVIGPVTASVLAELQPKAKIKGDVNYRSLEMHTGAVVDGSLVHLEANAS